MIDAFNQTKIDLIKKGLRRIDETQMQLYRMLGQIEEEIQAKDFEELEKELANDK